MVDFVNRSEELDRLYDLFDLGNGDLAVVYGRRRLGKTRLVKKALEGREDAVFYQARQKTQELQREQFIEAAADTFPSIEDIRRDWERVFRYLVDRDAIVVLDEFPYLFEQDESLLSVLRHGCPETIPPNLFRLVREFHKLPRSQSLPRR